MYPEIINEVKQLIGDDIILWGSSLFCKKEKNGKKHLGIKMESIGPSNH